MACGAAAYLGCVGAQQVGDELLDVAVNLASLGDGFDDGAEIIVQQHLIHSHTSQCRLALMVGDG